MPVRVTGQAREIAKAIDNFPAAYHAGFSDVRAIGRRYVAAAAPADDVVAELAQALRGVLGRWGAGKREAPELRGAEEVANVLRHGETHASLASLGRISLSALNSLHGRRYLNGKLVAPEELATFESNLFGALHILGEHLFVRNTNATYPMKAVLLITGFMPAFDSQVRSGLQRGGFLGMDKTQYLLPTDATRADGKKIARLPFLLCECWAACTWQLHKGIENSKYRELLGEPGRVFDVLLFMQANKKNPVLVTYDPPGQSWYDWA